MAALPVVKHLDIFKNSRLCRPRRMALLLFLCFGVWVKCLGPTLTWTCERKCLRIFLSSICVVILNSLVPCHFLTAVQGMNFQLNTLELYALQCAHWRWPLAFLLRHSWQILAVISTALLPPLRSVLNRSVMWGERERNANKLIGFFILFLLQFEKF